MSSGDIPGDQCEFVLDHEDVPDEGATDYAGASERWAKADGLAYCCRDVWAGADDGRCIWHAETEDKPAEELADARVDGPERLDGACLEGVGLGDAISFAECSLVGARFERADLSGTDLRGADLAGANLSRTMLEGADLSDASLERAEFSDAILAMATFSNADLRETEFLNAYLSKAKFSPDAGLEDVDFRGAEIMEADFSATAIWGTSFADANLQNTTFNDAFLSDVVFPDASLVYVDLSGAVIRDSMFTGAYLKEVQFNDAQLKNAAFEEADLIDVEFPRDELQEADLHDARPRGTTVTALEDAVLTGADLSGVDLSGLDLADKNLEHVDFSGANLFDTDLRRADLYGAGFDGASMNRRTEFGGHYLPTRPRGQVAPLARLRTVGRELRLALSRAGVVSDEDDRLDKAAWTFRRVEQLSEDAGLSKQARSYNVRRKDVERRLYLVEDGSRWRWTLAMLSSLGMRYGQNPWRVVAISLLVIVAAASAYVQLGLRLTGGSETTLVGGGTGTIPLPTLVGKSLYFSTITFTTVGYGDIQPVGWSQTIATFESFLGALLMALLVYVLGRRATW